MRQFTYLIGIIFVIISLSSQAFALNEFTRSITIFRLDPDHTNEVPDLRTGNRAPRRLLYGTISTEGVEIPGVDPSSIYSFEIYSTDNICIGVFDNETDFIDTLFSLSGEYEVRFLTEDFVFVGIIEI